MLKGFYLMIKDTFSVKGFETRKMFWIPRYIWWNLRCNIYKKANLQVICRVPCYFKIFYILYSENSTTGIANTPSSSITENSNGTSTAINSTQLLPNYTDEIQEIFKTFNDIREILHITKFIQCIKNIATQTKKLNNAMKKF